MKAMTILIATALVLGAVAVPASAEHKDDHQRPDRADRDGRDDNRTDDQNRTDKDRREEAKERRDEAKENKTRGPAAHATAKFLAKCEAYKNETGETHRKCEVAAHVAKPCVKDRRAAHAGLKAIDALEHRIVKLERFELRAMKALEDGNLTENQTAKLEAKMERIQAAQNKSIEKIDKIEERMERMKDRCDKVKDHIRDHAKVTVCHVGEDGNETLRISASALRAHMAHNDTKGPCPEDVDLDADLGEEAPEEDEDATKDDEE